MIQGEKQLLLKDLCARLPYGVKCYAYQFKIDGNDCECYGTFEGILHERFYLSNRIPVNGGKTYDEYYLEVKPYLRPMSSMTEEEIKEFVSFTSQSMHRFICESTNTDHWYNAYEEEDWLLAHHFDYRGLIEKGLALEAPEEMYKLKQ